MRKILKKTVRVLDSVMNVTEFVICLFLVLIALYCVWDAKLLYDSAGDTSLLRFKPGYEKDDTDGRQILKDSMVAWITIDDTSIDYPVMQGETNNDFINTDPYGDYSLSGSIFLDFRNSRDFSDPYSLIYGHHMDHGYMFGALDDFMDEKYFFSHQSGTLTVGKKVRKYTILAVMTAHATDDEIFAPTEIGTDRITGYIRGNASVIDPDFDEKIKGKKILACSTCKFPDTPERTVIAGVLD